MAASTPTSAGFPFGLRRLAALATYVAVVIAVIVFGGSFTLQIATLGGIMAISAMALTILTGTAGLLSLGQAAFLGIGAFTAGLLTSAYDVPFLLVILAAGLAGLSVGALIAAITLRNSGLYLAVGTFALHYIIVLVLNDIEVNLTHAVGFILPLPTVFWFSLRSPVAWWIFTATILALVYVALNWLVKSHIGRTWTVTRVNATIAGALGVSLMRSRLSAFTLTSFITSACGAIQGYYLGIVVASSYTLHLAIIYLTVVALGGLGSLPGAVVASYAITLLPFAIEHMVTAAGLSIAGGAAGLENILLGLILIAALLKLLQRLRPAGREKSVGQH